MKKPRKAVKSPIQPDTSSQEAEVRAVGEKINKILNEAGMGMQPVIQIFKLPPKEAPSPIIMAGNTNEPSNIITETTDNDRAMMEALKPLGDKIG